MERTLIVIIDVYQNGKATMDIGSLGLIDSDIVCLLESAIDDIKKRQEVNRLMDNN